MPIQSKLCVNDREAVAYALYDAGFQCIHSTNLADMLTAGYEPDEHGDFVYPLVMDHDDDTIVPWERVKLMHKYEQKEKDAPNFYDANIARLEDGDFVIFNGEVFVKYTLPTPQQYIYFIDFEQKHALQMISPFKQTSGSAVEWEAAKQYKNVLIKLL